MKIFLSYSAADREWVNELASVLRSNGVEVSDRESGFHLGDDVDEFFRRSIESADYVVPVVTPRWTHSPNALFELGAARAMKKQILVLRVLAEHEITLIPEFIANNHFIDAESPRDAAGQIRQHVAGQMAGV